VIPSLRVMERGRPDLPPALLLHGFTGSAEAWGEAILGGLDPHARLLAVDLPGHGESPAPPGSGGWGMEEVLTALLETLDRAGVAQADWIGYSMGGRIALGAAVLHPERVRRLILESARPGLSTDEERDRRRRQDEALARRLETGGIEAFVDFWLAQPLFATQRRLPPRVRDGERARRLRQDPRALAAALRGMGTGSQPSFFERLPEVRIPTLLVTGSEDQKFEAVSREMEELLPRAVHRSVPGAGHAVHLEAPKRWLEAVIPFLRARESSGVTATG
jgi:2-succinyl-6-hydroxy-2,4-cyclohexadiene-1-carboxylate synthase